jgi:glycosyltransferase involved in cell wall biosynthesis
MIKLAFILPCYNESEIISDSALELNTLRERLILQDKVSEDSAIVFVNDGSTDETWNLITKLHKGNARICGINLRKNVGHQNAIYAGMMELYRDFDAIVTIDADLQDDLNVIDTMLLEYINGADIVYAVKEKRNSDNLFKRVSAYSFYKVQKLCGIDAMKNHADFRLMSQKAIHELSKYSERNLYLRGIIPMLGMRSVTVSEEIRERRGGTSKYTLSKMLRLGCDGITSFSVTPINFIVYAGVFMMLIALGMFCYVVGSVLFSYVVPGWASIMISLWFIGAVITLAIGIIGIYVGKIFIEVKHRPLYSIQEVLGINNEIQ